MIRTAEDLASSISYGSACWMRGDLEGAEEAYREALAFAPSEATLHFNLALVFEREGKVDDAIAGYRSAASLAPTLVPAWQNLGLLLLRRNDLSTARDAFQKVLAVEPENVEALNALGNVERKAANTDQAQRLYSEVIDRRPDHIDAQNNLGVLLNECGMIPESLRVFEKALRLRPDHAPLHLNYAFALLSAGEYRRGFEEYEWRMRMPGSPVRSLAEGPVPRWTGEPLEGKKILVVTEQGFGDTIQFSRYVPMLTAAGAQVVVSCQPTMKSLLQSSFPNVQCDLLESSVTSFDHVVPLLSLPLMFGTELKTIPSQCPYLHPAPAVVAGWFSRMKDHPSAMRVGVVWSGSATNSEGRDRSCPVELFAPLFQIPGILFVSLQTGTAASEINRVGPSPTVVDLGSRIHDFHDTASIMESLDLVISIDTASAHLAGALGKNVWTIIPAAPDWRWQHDTDRSSWYPSMRLFRQKRYGEWEEVLGTLRRELAALTESLSTEFYNRGLKEKEQGRIEPALEFFENAVRLAPRDPDALFMHGNTALVAQRYPDAIASYSSLFREHPKHVGGLINCGVALQRNGNLVGAVACFDAALAIQPDNVDAHWNRGYSLLLAGRYPEGWEEWEWRWNRPQFQQMFARHTSPRWDGAPLNGKRILVWVEQGFGDAIQFVRYVPMVRDRGGEVILACQPELKELFARIDGLKKIITWGEPIPGHDVQIPVGSLPLVFGTTIDSVPARIPYLRAAAAHDCGPRTVGEIVVGIVWAGNASPDPHRSLDTSILERLSRVEHARFVSLQKGSGVSLPENFVDAAPMLTDFDATASCIASLDLVVSVDTAVAHLAGAMGKPTWVLLPYAPDWRWQLETLENPWYPTMRLFRQQAPGDWNGALEKLVGELSFVADNVFRQTRTSAERAEGAAIARRLMKEGDFAGAEASMRLVHEHSPADPDVHNNLGLILLCQEKVEESIGHFREAIRLDPLNADAHMNLGLALLTSGQFEDGWREHAWRKRTRKYQASGRTYQVPEWQGEPLLGKAILLHTEQGLGDAIQFVRLVPAVAAYGGEIFLECPTPLADLFKDIPGISKIVSTGEILPPHHFHLTLMDLPLILGDVPGKNSSIVPYLAADHDAVARWRNSLSAHEPAVFIGISWTGNPSYEDNARRSIDPALLMSLGALPGICLVSLQHNAGPLSVPPNVRFIDVRPPHFPFAEAAALIQALDLVISVDTSVNHLAGALGKPVWTLLQHGPDWRWQRKKPYSVWYPSMRLYRQTTPGDWHGVIGKVRQDLSAFVAGLNNEGAKRSEAGDYAGAVELFRKTVAAVPDDFRALNNAGRALHELGDFSGALAHFNDALRIAPDIPDIHNNLGNTLKELGQYSEAIDCYRRAITLRPDFVEAHWNLSLVLLLTGALQEGWNEYEWRWQKADFSSPRRHIDKPLWDGSLLDGRTILLHAEQGFGDAIQFIRYVPFAIHRGGRVMIECDQSLKELFAFLEGVEGVYGFGETLPHFDVHCPLMSLPRLASTDIESIPAHVPYLRSMKPSPLHLPNEDELVVGIVWSGNPHWKNLRNRSIEADALLSLSVVPGVKIVSLQMGEARAEFRSSACSQRCIDAAGAIHDFADTAALISQCDLVISIDTGVAHLAGALGRQVWVILPKKADWRWLLDRETSPWYPTMRLFRQTLEGQWGDVCEQVKAMLRQASGIAAFIRGNNFKQTFNYTKAAVSYTYALENGLDRPEVWNNLGLVRKAEKDSRGAEECYRRALALDPAFVLAHANLGYLFVAMGQPAKAAMHLREAIRLSPGYVDAHWLLSHVLLLSGEFQEGWREYEWRWKKADFATRERQFNEPRWSGEDLRGKTILLWVEQGLGDAMQFIRYAPLVKAKGGTVVVECQRALARLFTGIRGIDQVVPRGETVPHFDMQCPLMSLPMVFGMTEADIPAEVPYIVADESESSDWKTRIERGDGDRYRVGIVWSGNPQHNDDRNRSIDISLVRPFAKIPGVRLISLQVGAVASTAADIPADDCSDGLHDLADTAALIAGLDLVITVDTSVAHLAGAMGKPVWVLLPWMPDWRWMLGREDSPWYPTMRLFRQDEGGDWRKVVDRVHRELLSMADGRHSPMLGHR